MSRPEVDEILLAYLAVAPHVVSLVLIRVDCGVQKPIYYMKLRSGTYHLKRQFWLWCMAHLISLTISNHTRLLF